MHVVFLELIIDPACSVVFEAEPEEKNVMTRKPRPVGEPLFGRKVLGVSILQGAVVLAILVAVYAIARGRGQSDDQARALTFTALIVANLALILTNRSWSRGFISTLRTPNKALWWVLGGAVLFLGLVLYVPALRQLFRFGVLHAVDILICLAAGVVSVAWFEGLKAIRAKKERAAEALG